MRKISLVDQLEKILLIEATSKHNNQKTELDEDIERILSLDDFPDESENKKAENRESVEYTNLLRKTVKVFAEHPETAFFNLGEADIKLLAKAYQRISNDLDMSFNARSLIKYARIQNSSFKVKIAYCTSLLDRNVFIVTRSYDCYRKKIESLLDSHFELNTYLLNILMGFNYKLELIALLETKIEQTDKPLEIIWDYFDKFMDYSGIEYTNLREKYHYFGHIFLQFTEILWNKVSQLPDGHKIKMLADDFELDQFPFTISLLTYYYSNYKNEPISILQIANLLSTSIQSFDDNFTYLNGNGKLFEQCLIKKTEQTGSENWDLELSGKLLQRMNELTKNKDTGESIEIYIKNNESNLKILHTDQTIDQLILHKDEMRTISTIIERLKNPVIYNLSKWGLVTSSLSSDTASLNSCIILLHGYPGTGNVDGS